MSYNGSGVFNINTSGQPVVTGTVISSTAFNALTADLATGLTTALTKDGQTTPTANIKLGGFKLTGIGVATTSGDALSYGQAATVSTLTNSALTSGRVPYASTAGLLVDSSTFTYNGTTVTVPQLTDSGLTNGRVTFAGASGLLTDSANLTFGGSTLTVLNNASAQSIYLSRTSATARDWALGIDGDGALRITDATSGNVIFSAGAAGITTLTAITELVFKANNAEQMRLTSTGLGIGTTSPTAKLQVAGSGFFTSRSVPTSGAGPEIYYDGTNASWLAYNRTSSAYIPSIMDAISHKFGISGGEGLRINSSGNVGIGVTPSAWSSGKVVEIGNYGNAFFNNGAAENHLTTNAYYNSGWKFGGTGYAQKLTTDSGQYQFNVSTASGTAGNAISFTQSMTLDASGNLLVGRTDASAGNLGGKIASTGFIEAVVNNSECFSANRKNGTGTLMLLQYQNSTKGSISTDGTNVAYNTSSDYRLKENIVNLSDALSIVMQLKPRQFDWIETKESTTGFIAHELAEIIPHAVTGEKDAIDEDGNPKYQGIDTSFLVATLTAAIQELNARLTALESK